MGRRATGQVTLSWDAPSSDGGSAIVRYEVAIDDSGTWIDAGLDLEETVTGLTNGQRYTVAVRAVNAAGAGPATTMTIVTSHPVPQAWLARFGRAATDHVVDAVSNRWQGGPQASHLTIGGSRPRHCLDGPGAEAKPRGTRRMRGATRFGSTRPRRGCLPRPAAPVRAWVGRVPV